MTVALVGRDPPANAGDIRDTGSNPGSERLPWRKAWQPTPVFLPEESHRPRSLAGYIPRGRKESDTTEVIYQVPPPTLYLFIYLEANYFTIFIGFVIH